MKKIALIAEATAYAQNRTLLPRELDKLLSKTTTRGNIKKVRMFLKRQLKNK